MPAKTIVKITIITTGVSIAHAMPSADPLYRAANSRLVSESTRSNRRGSCHNGRHTARRAVCAEIIIAMLAVSGNNGSENFKESFHFRALADGNAHIVRQGRK